MRFGLIYQIKLEKTLLPVLPSRISLILGCRCACECKDLIKIEQIVTKCISFSV